jgi:hypothetical protein
MYVFYQTYLFSTGFYGPYRTLAFLNGLLDPQTFGRTPLLGDQSNTRPLSKITERYFILFTRECYDLSMMCPDQWEKKMALTLSSLIFKYQFKHHASIGVRLGRSFLRTWPSLRSVSYIYVYSAKRAKWTPRVQEYCSRTRIVNLRVTWTVSFIQ